MNIPNNTRTVTKKISFIGPIGIKNAPKNLSGSEYKRVSSLDDDGDGIVDYEELSTNPYNKVDDYVANNASDEEILNDIKNYKENFVKTKYFGDWNRSDSDILKDIHRLINEKNNNMATISAQKPMDETSVLQNHNQEIAIPSSKYWYSENNVSKTNAMTSVDINNLEYINDDVKSKSKQMQDDITEQRRILASLEGLEQYFKHNINDVRNYKNALGSYNDSGMPSFQTLSIVVDGVTYSYDQYQGDEALKNIRKQLQNQKQKVQELEKDLWNYKENEIRNTDYYKSYIASLNVDSVLVKTGTKIVSNGHMTPQQKQQFSTNITTTTYLTGKDNYKYMTIEEKEFYCYLADKLNNKTLADSYLSSIQNDINKRAGEQLAVDFINSFRDEKGNLKEGFWEYFGISASGLGDGINAFFENVNYIFVDTDIDSIEYYKRVAIAEYLALESKNLEKTYTTSESIGESLPPYVGALMTFLVSEGNAEASKVVFKSMKALEDFGKNKHKALKTGLGTNLATVYEYAFLQATKGYAITTLVNSIPGLTSDSTTIITAAIKNGIKTSSIDTVGKRLDELYLNEEIDTKDWAKDTFESFLVGAIIGAIDFGVEDIHFVDGKFAYLDRETAKEIAEYLKEHENVTVMKAIQIVAPSFYSAFAKEVPEDILDFELS